MKAAEKAAKGRSARMQAAPPTRSTVRKRQRMTDGYIWSEAMLKPRPCTIKDMSALGAQIEIWNDEIKAHAAPGLAQALSSSDSNEVDCKMTWRKGNSAGLGSRAAFMRRRGSTPDNTVLMSGHEPHGELVEP